VIDLDLNSTYEKIEAIYVNSADVSNSLLVLRAKEFGVAHIITYGAAYKSLKSMKVIGNFSSVPDKKQYRLGGTFLEIDDMVDSKTKICYKKNGENVNPTFIFT